jgi:hypothetical protein
VTRGLLLTAGALLLARPSPAAAEVVIGTGASLPLGMGMEARVGRGGISISLNPRGHRSAGRRSPRLRRIRRALTRLPPPRDRGVASGADSSCLEDLDRQGVRFVPAGAVRGIATPIEVTGPIGGVQLLARGRRAPLMDCELARSLARAAPFLRDLGVTGLSYSSTYNYRTVRGSSKLSGHAFGLAIDVHAVETTIGHLDVERDYAKDPGRWRGGDRGRSTGRCVGEPIRPEGRLLRAVACGLRTQRDLRLVLTPDDNYDHRHHLHIEAYPGRSRELLSGRSPSLHWGRRAAR